MSDISPQRISEFMRIVFVRLWTEPEGMASADLLAQIPLSTRLSPAELECLPGTVAPRYQHAVRLASIPFVKAGWLEKSKGRWYITEAGKRACKAFSSGEAFSQEAARLMASGQENRLALALVTEQAEETAWEQLRTFLLGLQSYEFQALVGHLLTAMGYHLSWVAPPEKEHGYVNFVMYPDSLGLGRPRIKVHIMHTGQPVLFEGLKAFTSVLGEGDAGVFVSSGGFIPRVVDEVVERRDFLMTLIDLPTFADLWLEYYDRLTEQARLQFPLTPVHFLAAVG